MKRNRCRSLSVSHVLLAGLVAVALKAPGVLALDNGVALTPPMGWNTFNQFGGNWKVADLKANADSLVSTGMRDVGYIYCNNDGNAAGDQPYWPGRAGFVAWATPLSEYMHSKGLRFGTYMTTTTDAKATVNDLVAANVDFLKHDDWTLAWDASVFPAMRDALLATQRPIVYSIHSANEVLAPEYAHMIRTVPDITAAWPKIMEVFDENYSSLSLAGPGKWADPDMLETGCTIPGGVRELTNDEDRAHFSMWCMMASPLLIGYDISRRNSITLGSDELHVRTMAIFSNIELIAVDQDSLGMSGRRIKGQGAKEVWLKPLNDSTEAALAFFNRTSAQSDIAVTKAEILASYPQWGNPDTIYIRDLWLHQDQPPITGTFTKSVKSHAAEIYRISPHPITGVEQQLRKMDRAVWWLEQNGYSVFPRKMVLNVMQGTIPGARVFDLRGRALSVDPSALGTGNYVIRASAGDRSIAAKMMWPGMSR